MLPDHWTTHLPFVVTILRWRFHRHMISQQLQLRVTAAQRGLILKQLRLTLSWGLLNFKRCAQAVCGGVSNTSQFLSSFVPKKVLPWCCAPLNPPKNSTTGETWRGNQVKALPPHVTPALTLSPSPPEPRLLPDGHYKVRVLDLHHNTSSFNKDFYCNL